MRNPSINLTSFEDHLDNKYGQEGTETREAYEQGYESFKTAVLSQQARKILQEDQQLLEKIDQKSNYKKR